MTEELDEDTSEPGTGRADAGVASDIVANRGIRLRLPVNRTPVADVTPALPFLNTLGRLLTAGPVPFKLALIKTLVAEGTGPWRIEEIQDRIDWLEPTSTATVTRALRQDGVLDYQQTLRRYVLTPAGRSASLLIDLLCQPGDEARIIHELDALMAHALARDADWSELLHLFAIAVAHLRGARHELEELLAADTRETLLEAAERADGYVEQMKRLVEHHGGVLDQHRFDAAAGQVLTSASELVPEVAMLVYRAQERLVEQAEDLRRFGVRIDRDTVRTFLEGTSHSDLAAIVAGWARPAPTVPAIDLEAAAAALQARLERQEQPSWTPPPPRGLSVISRPARRTPVEDMRARLLALREPTPWNALVVGAQWPDAVAASAQLLQALSGEDRAEMPSLVLRSSATEAIRRGGVWRIADAQLDPSPRHAEDAAP